MKKILAILCVLVLVFAVVACSDKGDEQGADTTAPSKTEGKPGKEDPPKPENIREIDISKYYKGYEFELPESSEFRQTVVDYMYEQASVKWVCSANFGVSEQWAQWGINLSFVKGLTYTGQPYANTQVNVNLFKRVLVDGTYTAPSASWDVVHGSQCVSSVLNALQQVMKVDGWSYSLNPSSEAFQSKILGDYKVNVKPVNQEEHTKSVCDRNGEKVIYDSYKLLQKGDVITMSNALVHIRMIVENKVVYKEDGTVDPHLSKVKCIEQTNSFDSVAKKKGIRTTWFVDHEYNYVTLFNAGYLPITYEVYETGVTHVPAVVLDRKTEASSLGNKRVWGNIISNYPLRYVVMEVLNKDGSTASQRILRGQMNTRELNLVPEAANLFKDVKPGDYTFVLTAGLAMGEYEFERIDFTLN